LQFVLCIFTAHNKVVYYRHEIIQQLNEMGKQNESIFISIIKAAVLHVGLCFYINTTVITDKKLSYRRGTARRAVSVKTVLNVAQMFVELHLISHALGE